jgi:murein DD-endopeptidase MepM/ murein hydrolase activator NlpD
LRKRFYFLFVTRDSEGELRKIYIPLRYIYFFLAGIILGMLTITGIAGSYTRMALKVAHFNQLRSEKEQLRNRYARLERADKEKEIQVASLSSLASEVSALYGLKSQPLASPDGPQGEIQFTASLDRFYALKHTALSGAAGMAISLGFNRSMSVDDWVSLAESPSLWPVEGPITGPFGARIDPFKGEGAFHRGVDISAAYGRSIVAPADGTVTYADFYSGYGRMVIIEHGHGILTRYGHMSGFTVVEGEEVKRGDVIGYVGMSGRSTGPHLHYEVWVHGVPVNPYKYLRASLRK